MMNKKEWPLLETETRKEKRKILDWAYHRWLSNKSRNSYNKVMYQHIIQ